MTPHTAQLPTARDFSILLAQATDIPPMELEFQMKLLLQIFINFEVGRLVTHTACEYQMMNKILSRNLPSPYI